MIQQLAQMYTPRTNYHMVNGYGSEWFDFARFVIGMLVLVLVASLLWRYLARHAQNGNLLTETNVDPLAVVKARYAKGDITKDEFLEIKKNILD